MRVSYWQKLEEAKKKGLTREQIEEIEALEAAIAQHQNIIEEYEKEIKAIEGEVNLQEPGEGFSVVSF
jgi:flagellar biosynthesis chaperone FliJ